MKNQSNETLKKEVIYWMQDYQAHRPHIDFSKKQNGMDNPFNLAEKVDKEWNRKSKGHKWILSYLSEKKLSRKIEKNQERESKKALYHLEKQFKPITSYNKVASKLSPKIFLYEDFDSALKSLKTKQINQTKKRLDHEEY